MKITNYQFPFEDTIIRVPMISYRRFSEPLPRHSHGKNAFELHYVTEGKGTVIIGKEPYALSPGVLYMTGPNVSHEQIPDEAEPLTEFGLFFLMSEKGTKSPLIRTFMQHDRWIGNASEEIRALAHAILEETTNSNYGFAQKIPLLLSELLIECARLFVSRSHPVERKLPSPTQSIDVNMLQEENTLLVVDEIFLCRYADVTLEQLAAVIGLSKRQTQRLLNKYYNKSFSAMKLESRMAAAETLLRNSTYSITEISNKTGYSSIEHFTNAFKKFYKVSPGRYRGMLREK